MKRKYLSPRMLTIDMKQRYELLLVTSRDKITSKDDDPADEAAMSCRWGYLSWDDDEDEEDEDY